MIDNDERFRNEILSIIPAAPGWRVGVAHEAFDPQTRERSVERKGIYPIVAWALVRGPESTEIEPVFCDDGRMVNATEHQRVYSDLNPTPGDPRLTVHIRTLEPAGTDDHTSGVEL